MGLNKNNNNFVFAKISAGKIRIKTDKSDPDHVYRKVTVNEKVYEMYELVYDSFTGFIQGVTRNEHPQYGTSWNIIMSDGDQTISFSFGEDGNYFTTFAQKFPNVDITKEVTIAPYSKAIEGKPYRNQGISFYQGEPVPNYYKDWDNDTKKSTLKNGLEKFPWNKDMSKDDLAVLKIKIKGFLRKELDKYIPKAEDVVKPNAPKAKPETTEDLPY